MLISSVSISNYRGIKSAKVDTSPCVCIIGENNAGKSTVLLAISLFFSGTSLSSADYFDLNEPILIELVFSDIIEADINRLSIEHRERIKSIILNGSVKLVRRYSPGGGKSEEILCEKLMPIDERYSKEYITKLMKGVTGKQLQDLLVYTYSSDSFKEVNSQKKALEVLELLISEMQEHELEYKLTALPTGIDRSISAFLPEPIYIAAVKDLKDDVKSKESTAFGKLLSILARFIEHSDEIVNILNSFDVLNKYLNRVEENGTVKDYRLDSLVSMENLISKFLQENFPKAKIELNIPKPELRQIFSNAKIIVDDGVKDSIETKGDGIKRAVTFALLRTYVEQLKLQKISSNSSAEDPKEDLTRDQPYIFLFEEPELYLHPRAQIILFEALEKLSQNDNQVFITTHSPVFFSPKATGTFIKIIKKYSLDHKPFGRLLSINLHSNVEFRHAFQIICYENNAAAFFFGESTLS
jgi:putative ATP-dependent endonuclease of OLD family